MEDFVRGLRDIHRQFEWPMPVLSSAALNQLKKSRAGESCLANISLEFFLTKCWKPGYYRNIQSINRMTI